MKVLISDKLPDVATKILTAEPSIQADNKPGMTPDQLKALQSRIGGQAQGKRNEIIAEMMRGGKKMGEGAGDINEASIRAQGESGSKYGKLADLDKSFDRLITALSKGMTVNLVGPDSGPGYRAKSNNASPVDPVNAEVASRYGPG